MIKNNYIIVILIIVLSLISYINVFDNEFVWDDHDFILDNADIKSFSNIPSFFTEDVDGLYRPLRTVHYAVAYSVFRKNEFGYHLNSVFFHVLISVLVFFIIKKIVNKKGIALVAALIFAVHPIHVERVANMTAGFDLLGIFLFLLAFYFYILFSKINDKKYFIVSILLFILALFASEEAITLPFLIILYEFTFNNEKLNKKNIKNSILKNYLIFFMIALSFIVLRFFILGISGRIETYLGGSFYITMLTMTKAFVKYIVLLIFPFNLTLFQEVPIATGFFDLGVLLSIFILTLILIFTIMNHKNKVIFFSVFWFFITLATFSNIIPIQIFMAERYLYVPSIGFSILVSFILFNIYNLTLKNFKNKIILKKILIILFILLLSFYSIRTIIRNNDWQDNLTLWTKTIETNPFNSMAHDNLGFTYDHFGDEERAFFEFDKAVELMPSNFRALSNLGVAYGQRKEYDKAILTLNKAIQINPLHYRTYDKLGLIYFELNQIGDSIGNFEKAIEINPRYAKAYNDLATVQGRIGQFDTALENLKTAIRLDRDYADAHYNLGVLYEFLNEKGLASKEFDIAISLESENELYKRKIN